MRTTHRELVVRAVWLVMAVAVTYLFASDLSMPISNVSLSCSKIGEGDGDYQCGDRAVDVLGIGQYSTVGALLVVPPTAAALVARSRFYWLTNVVLAGLAVAGITQWADTSFWKFLIVAAPMAAVGTVTTVLHQTFLRTTSGRSS